MHTSTDAQRVRQYSESASMPKITIKFWSLTVSSVHFCTEFWKQISKRCMHIHGGITYSIVELQTFLCDKHDAECQSARTKRAVTNEDVCITRFWVFAIHVCLYSCMCMRACVCACVCTHVHICVYMPLIECVICLCRHDIQIIDNTLIDLNICARM